MMKYQFHVGQAVVVDNLNDITYGTPPGIVERMREAIGRGGIITRISDNGNPQIDNHFYYHPEWLKPIFADGEEVVVTSIDEDVPHNPGTTEEIIEELRTGRVLKVDSTNSAYVNCGRWSYSPYWLTPAKFATKQRKAKRSKIDPEFLFGDEVKEQVRDSDTYRDLFLAVVQTYDYKDQTVSTDELRRAMSQVCVTWKQKIRANTDIFDEVLDERGTVVLKGDLTETLSGMAGLLSPQAGQPVLLQPLMASRVDGAPELSGGDWNTAAALFVKGVKPVVHPTADGYYAIEFQKVPQ